MSTTPNRRILVVDDMSAIHDDFRKILAPEVAQPGLADMEAALFGAPAGAPKLGFELESAYQGQEALAMVAAAVADKRPYAMAFVDMRMPPGWDGVETIEHLWEADEQLQVVICTAYSDHSWESVLSRLDMRDRLLILKKPFDAIEVAQLARALTAKWQRTGELLDTMADLRQATLEAQQASRAKSEFVATMSHELRTPMNGVIGAIGVLEQSALSAEQRGLLAMAGESAQALMEIVDDILDFSKIEAGGVVLERRPLSIATVIAKACALLAGAASDKGVSLCSRVDAGVPAAIWGDATRLRQLLVNLLGNAIKFSRREGGSRQVEVRARAVAGAPGEQRLELAVVDDGIGMDAATVARLFEPFSQADSTSTRRYGGTGLGLAISKRLVVAMGGDIRVTSAPLAGSTFTVSLPLEVDPAQAVASESPLDSRQATAPMLPSSTPAADEAASPPGLILVAEDNPINQRIILAQLDAMGFRAEVASDGREALARLREGNFALLITDLQMPEMDGFELSTRIRNETGPLSRLPIVALTANALEGESERCAAAGMNDYFTKPVQLAGLQATIQRLLGREITPVTGAAARSPGHRPHSLDEPVDPSVLAEVVGSEPSELGELFRRFAQSADEAAEVLRTAAAAGRASDVATAAHRLRGSSRSIGASRLGDRCEQTEAAARNAADTSTLAPSLSQLFDELALVRAWIHERYVANA